ncbi:MAG: hypothetical protein A2X79_07490 [Desulfuromonadaceae bacterium GWB2_53_15]|nr:MAG: hypothetical protein A2X79_07490 [Desulfuromonadaceae bacterium GWB2_53_15]
MTLAGIVLIIIAVAFCILVLALVPTLLTIKRTAESVASLSEMLQKELKPTIQELTAVLTELKTVGGGIAEHTDDVKEFMSALGETGSNLHTINRSVRVVSNVLNTTTVWVSGAKVAGRYLIERYLKKRGGN